MTRFAFYQEVRLTRPQLTNAPFQDLVGAVVGIGDEPGQPVLYGVAIPGHDYIVSCEEHELEPTGRQFRREDFYDDSKAIRVRVDENGRGNPV